MAMNTDDYRMETDEASNTNTGDEMHVSLSLSLIRGDQTEDACELDVDADETVASLQDKRSIVSYNPPWPICEYSNMSVRLKPPVSPLTLSQYLSGINNWSDRRSISIDGMNGIGKSTLAESMNRSYMKINRQCPEVTAGSHYNISPLRALEYVMHFVLYDTDDAFVVWDRCCFSNLIFSYVHYLMSVYRDRIIPEPNDDDEPLLYINNMALATGLFMTVSYLNAVFGESQNILFIVCSDLRLVMRSLLERGGANDVYNSKELNYQRAQYHVYKYFARLLNAPLFDLCTMFDLFDLSLDEVHREIKRRIDVQPIQSSTVPPPFKKGEQSALLHSFCDSQDDTMIYNYSNK